MSEIETHQQKQEIRAALVAYWLSKHGVIRKYNLSSLATYLFNEGYRRQQQPVTEPTFIENLVSPDFLEGVRHGVELEHGEVEAAQQRIEELKAVMVYARHRGDCAAYQHRSCTCGLNQALQPTAAPKEVAPQ